MNIFLPSLRKGPVYDAYVERHRFCDKEGDRVLSSSCYISTVWRDDTSGPPWAAETGLRPVPASDSMSGPHTNFALDWVGPGGPVCLSMWLPFPFLSFHLSKCCFVFVSLPDNRAEKREKVVLSISLVIVGRGWHGGPGPSSLVDESSSLQEETRFIRMAHVLNEIVP